MAGAATTDKGAGIRVARRRGEGWECPRRTHGSCGPGAAAGQTGMRHPQRPCATARPHAHSRTPQVREVDRMSRDVPLTTA
eukprot:5970370-Alexandrium_andersonii.AAC.1